ncbi:hypothetical protein CCR85_09130 [Rhodothalassium salexigens]|uniref:type II secretion system protein GspM n=1 Tax=Rhodothalassium salexigens TaxID=1086 RepID=UPI001914278F|nr:type II secretion system protein GspM [Rhodothalassium salexigens]MBK5911648.1 hypothetical protein [Rhodothalassium salexigens]MBK5920941.1 hypothetical protein [Rhodothalassium salexigens]
MTGFWQDRSPRERWLIALAAAILIVLAGQTLVYRPLMAARAEAAAAARSAAALLAEVEAGAAEARRLKAAGAGLGEAGPGGAAGPAQSVRQLANAAARRHGLRIARLRPDEAGGLTVWIDAVRAPTLHAWLVELFRDHGLVVRRATLTRGDDGAMVAAQVQIVRPGTVPAGPAGDRR